ncbi:MAG: flagellar hook assembly protein FlgD [Gammaproteobacteria bacterium]|nr:flagellar hook assembly protein FlgD [Gammaproteobacteria bacterium]
MLASGTAAALPGPLTEPAAGARKEMPQFGADQFITLMLAQIKNQDPMKPLEPAEFLGQLAQFSTVTGIQGMSRSVSDMVGSMRSSQALSGANLVGHDVLAQGDTAAFDGATPVEGAVAAPSGASAVQFVVRDAAGAVVRRIDAEPSATGLTQFQWDGRRDDGSAMPAGRYRVSAQAYFGTRGESAQMLLRSRVDSVTLDAAQGGLVLNTPNGSMPLGAVRQVM